MTSIELRYGVRDEDRLSVRRIAGEAGIFNAGEIDVAAELIDARLGMGEAGGYRFIFSETGGRTSGYICYGPIALAVGRFDVYWIAVEPSFRRKGVGGALIQAAEVLIAHDGGERIFIDTSSRDEYRGARELYLRAGYHEAARVRDFYSDGDDKIIFEKRIKELR